MLGRNGRNSGNTTRNQARIAVPTSDTASGNGRNIAAEPAPEADGSVEDEPEWLGAGLAETWEDDFVDGSGERVPRLNVEMFADDGRQLHAFHGGEERVQQMKGFYASNPRMRVQVRPHSFGDGAGWPVVRWRADNSMFH